MNKQKFVECLREPENLDKQQFEDLKQLLVDHPYFSVAKSVAARASKNLEEENRGALISSAAIYATDRKRLKKYISGELIFLTEKPKVEEDSPEAENTPSVDPPRNEIEDDASLDLDNLTPPSPSDVDQILDELQSDMEELRKSRMYFAEVQSKIDTPEDKKKVSKKGKPKKSEKKVELQEDKTPTPEVVDPVAKEETSETTPEKQEAEIQKEGLSDLMIDLEALKKEFEEEEESEESAIESKVSGIVDDNTEDLEIEENIPDSSEQVDYEDEEAEKELSSPPPPLPRSGNIVTNMSEDEENDDNEPGMFDEGPEPEKPAPKKYKKLPARADRDMRMKIKRSELDQLMSQKSIPKPKSKLDAQTEIKEKTAETKAPTKKPGKKATTPTAKKTVAKKTTAKKVTESKEKKTEAKTPTKKTTTKTPAKKETKAATAKKAATKPAAKKTVSKKAAEPVEKKTTSKSKVASEEKEVVKKSTTTARASSKKAAAKKATEEKTVAPKKTVTKKTTTPQDDPANDPATRATRKALLDFGKAEGLSMSVSRASSSKRRRKSKGKAGDSGVPKKDDDESGGASAIIDKFIEENPSITRKSESTNKEDLSTKSSSWQDDVASEYLAEIYLEQGNKERAKKIYHNLILKFPEKKSYFAGLIQKLEE